jgi:hypothetical protein
MSFDELFEQKEILGSPESKARIEIETGLESGLYVSRITIHTISNNGKHKEKMTRSFNTSRELDDHVKSVVLDFHEKHGK